MKTKHSSKATLMRFPLIFGGLLSMIGIGFYTRENWLGDVEGAKSALYKENNETLHMLEDLKKEHRKKVESLK